MSVPNFTSKTTDSRTCLLTQRYDAGAPVLKSDSVGLVADAVHVLWFGPTLSMDRVCHQVAFDRLLSEWRAEACADKCFYHWVALIYARMALRRHIVIVALRLIFKLKRSDPNLTTSQGSHYRVFATAIFLAYTYADEHLSKLTKWATVTGFDVDTLLFMQRELLQIIKHDISVTGEDREMWQTILVRLKLVDWSTSQNTATTTSEQPRFRDEVTHGTLWSLPMCKISSCPQPTLKPVDRVGYVSTPRQASTFRPHTFQPHPLTSQLGEDKLTVQASDTTEARQLRSKPKSDIETSRRLVTTTRHNKSATWYQSGVGR